MACGDPQAQTMVLSELRSELPLPPDLLVLSAIRVISDGWFDQRHECAAVILPRAGSGLTYGTAAMPVSYETMVAINGRNLVKARSR